MARGKELIGKKKPCCKIQQMRSYKMDIIFRSVEAVLSYSRFQKEKSTSLSVHLNIVRIVGNLDKNAQGRKRN